MNIDTNQWMTGQQAYRQLGMSRQSFYRAAKAHSWHTLKAFDTILFSRADIARYKPVVGHPVDKHNSQKPLTSAEYDDSQDIPPNDW